MPATPKPPAGQGGTAAAASGSVPPHSSMLTTAAKATERRTNLTFAFLNAERLGRAMLTASWVIENVDGYATTPTGEARNPDTAKRMFLRDCQVLVAAGVPVEQVAANGQIGYRLQADTYQLPPLHFTPQEGAALAVASQLATHGELSGFSRSGWQKLAAAGVERELGGTFSLHTYSDLQTVSAVDLDKILRASSTKRPVRFSYTPHQQAPVQTRTLDPWGIITRADRLYLAGFCHDRQAPRTFRIRRIADVELLAPSATFHSAEGINLQDLLEEQLHRGKALTNATIEVRGNVPLWLIKLIQVEHGGTASAVAGNTSIDVHNVDRDFLIREAIASYPDVVVTAPQDLRAAIATTLSTGLASQTSSPVKQATGEVNKT